MIVASFLIRLEPFTQHFLKLQVGCCEILVINFLLISIVMYYYSIPGQLKSRLYLHTLYFFSIVALISSTCIPLTHTHARTHTHAHTHAHTHTCTQGGHFDLPDRLFHSVPDAWRSASESNMADIKELIPEFFYLPEFLVNSNRFDLGELRGDSSTSAVTQVQTLAIRRLWGP